MQLTSYEQIASIHKNKEGLNIEPATGNMWKTDIYQQRILLVDI